MLLLATLHPVEVRSWQTAQRAFLLAPHQQKTHVCILYSSKLQSGPWPGALFVMSKIKALAMFGTLPPPPFPCNRLINQACITLDTVFQTKVWHSFINIPRWGAVALHHRTGKRDREGPGTAPSTCWEPWGKNWRDTFWGLPPQGIAHIKPPESWASFIRIGQISSLSQTVQV